MKKPYLNVDLSDKKCACGKRLKKNLLAKKPNADKCWGCWYPDDQKRRGGHMQGRKEKEESR